MGSKGIEMRQFCKYEVEADIHYRKLADTLYFQKLEDAWEHPSLEVLLKIYLYPTLIHTSGITNYERISLYCFNYLVTKLLQQLEKAQSIY